MSFKEHANLPNPKLKDFTPYALPTPRWHRPLGILLGFVALYFLAGVFVAFSLSIETGATKLPGTINRDSFLFSTLG